MRTHEQITVININLTRRTVVLLALGLLTVACMGYLAWGNPDAAASSPRAPGAAAADTRAFYLSKGVLIQVIIQVFIRSWSVQIMESSGKRFLKEMYLI